MLEAAEIERALGQFIDARDRLVQVNRPTRQHFHLDKLKHVLAARGLAKAFGIMQPFTSERLRSRIGKQPEAAATSGDTGCRGHPSFSTERGVMGNVRS